MHWVTQPGTSNAEEVRVSQLACKELHDHPGRAQLRLAHRPGASQPTRWWASTSVRTGSASTPRVGLRRRPWPPIQEVVDGYPGIHRDVQTYLKERVREVLTGTGYAVVVRVYGDDLPTLREAGGQGQDRPRRGSRRQSGQNMALQVDVPQVDVEVNLEAANRYGLKPGDVRRAAATMVAGEEVGDIFRAGKAYDVQVWSTPGAPRQRPRASENLAIDTPSGQRIRLADVAAITVKPTPNVIERSEGSRRL